jgi:hypothetical protein
MGPRLSTELMGCVSVIRNFYLDKSIGFKANISSTPRVLC